MNVVITGGLGFLGRLLARHLAAGGETVTLLDVAGPAPEPGLEDRRGQVTDAGFLASVIGPETDAVVHLASMVSAACEADFDAALDTNLRGGLAVLEAARRTGRCPRFLFASSVAVYGTSAPVGDGAKQSPVTTYGMTKAVGELLVNEYTRKGFVDGRSARLPTVVVRPGQPNAAASGFASGMFREPLAGVDGVVPVRPDLRMCLIGHRTAVAGLAALLAVDGDLLGPDRAVGLPAVEVEVSEMVAAVAAHPRATGTLTVAPDPAIEAVVGSWPSRWDASRALALGLPADRSLSAIVEDYLADFG
jgi:nucleoside-diphosphate-sugar epimerase